MTLPLPLRVLPIVLSLVCGALFCTPAEACSCLPAGAINQAVPPDGATNVPVNVVPWVRARSEVQLLDPDGTVVPTVVEHHTFRVTLCVFTKDLRPVEPLKPNTTYRLKFEPDSTGQQGTLTQTSFTTGDAVLQTNDELVELRATVFDVGDFRSTCVESHYQACIDSGHREELIDVRVFDGDEQLIHYVDFANNLRNLELGAGENEGRADCIEVRARNLAGQTSAPARTCFNLANAPSLELESPSDTSEFSNFPDCDAPDLEERLVPKEPEQASCSLSETTSRCGGFAPGMVTLLGLGLLWVRRRGSSST